MEGGNTLDAFFGDFPSVTREHAVAVLEERAMAEWLEQFEAQDFSFADAVSFAVMRSRRIRNALTLDRHFAIAGYTMLANGHA